MKTSDYDSAPQSSLIRLRRRRLAALATAIARATAITLAIALAITITAGIAGCSAEKAQSFDIAQIASYREIPGIMQEDIDAIEALKQARQSFSYAQTPSTEFFEVPGVGFTAMFCDLLSELFGMPFVLEPLHWDALKSGLDSRTVDFTADLTPTAERKLEYSMTIPIAERGLKAFTIAQGLEINSENDLIGLRVGFLEGSVTARSITDVYPNIHFEIVDVQNNREAIDCLRNGEIDAFIDEETAGYFFRDYADITEKEVFAFVYTPVSLATANPELAPIIGAVDKYLAAGGIDKIYELYAEGENAYYKYAFYQSLSDSERAYIDGLASGGMKVPIALENDNYPISFYDHQEGDFQGIAVDILAEISKITGIEFEVMVEKDAPWHEIFEKLRTDEVTLVSQLIWSTERAEYFIWTEKPYASSRFAFLSKADYPNLRMQQIAQASVGVVTDTAYEDVYKQWFLDDSNVIYFDSLQEAFDALESGEVDLMLASENLLLTLSHYREKPGYKINLVIGSPIEESYFGLNKKETELRSIIDKAMPFINNDEIASNWTSRVYDYSRQLANERTVWWAVVAVMLLLLLGIVTFFLISNMRKGKIISELLQTTEDAKEFAERSSRHKSDFLAKMSHEIRTPMNAIIGMAELALREDEHDARTEHVFAVKQAGANLLAIINDILDFSKIEAGKMEIVPSDYSVASLLGDLISIIKMRAADKQIQFAVSADSNIPHTLYGDETRIRQALLNILINAVKFTEKGFVTFSVRGERASEPGANPGQTSEGTINLIFEVVDSGAGIKPDDKEKLFTNFTQFDLEKHRGIEGAGLGLAITQSIVEMMGGGITVRSEYGVGSTFTITLPQKYRSSAPLAAVEDAESKSVLIYERRIIYADSIAYAMGNLGVNYTLAANETELHEKIGSGIFDFLFISFTLYRKNEDAILKFGEDMQTVILAEFGEAVPIEHLHTLSLPTHCTYLADILNGVCARLSHAACDTPIVEFSAPNAKVLIVDDITINLKVAQGLLKPYDIQSDFATNGEGAIEAMQSKGYDAVFMDHLMPDMDGVETTRRIREMGESDSYYRDVPIIALTANAIFGIADMFIENGFDDFLPKPIDTVSLNKILEKWIPKWKQKEVRG